MTQQRAHRAKGKKSGMPGRSKTIRVGMIGCGRRALWYSAIFDRIDPEVYAELDPGAYHHLAWYAGVELINRQSKGFKLTRIYDPDQGATERFSEAFRRKLTLCRTLDEVSDDVDLVFVAIGNGDGKHHLKWATPGLEKGVPTFMDRPLAGTVKEAQALLQLARRRRTPLMSCSHMRMQPHVNRFKNRFAELEPIERGIIHGPGSEPGDIADAVELGLHLFGDDFKGRIDRVQSMGQAPLEAVLLTYENPKAPRRLLALVTNRPCAGARRLFHATAASNFRQIHLDDVDASVQSEGGFAVMEAVKQMVRTGTSPIPPREMFATVAALEAARKSHGKPKAVSVRAY